MPKRKKKEQEKTVGTLSLLADDTRVHASIARANVSSALTLVKEGYGDEYMTAGRHAAVLALLDAAIEGMQIVLDDANRVLEEDL